MSTITYYNHTAPFVLESGAVVPKLRLAYQIWGDIYKNKDKIVWVFHAFSGNTDCMDWWKGLIGDNDFINPNEYCIICVNMPGSCYGSTNALSINPINNQPYYYNFPLFTTRDVANAFDILRSHLHINNIYLGLGGSMGGQILLEWSILQPLLFTNIALIATSAAHTPYGIAFNTAQRQAIQLDKTWGSRNTNAGINGMKVARSIALLSYRNAHTYKSFQYGFMNNDISSEKKQIFKASSYQIYQGEKLAQRFNAFAYWYLSKTMDSHNVGRGRVSVINALKAVKANTLILSLEKDLLFPKEEQLYLLKYITNTTYAHIATLYGHDGFLIETQSISKQLQTFLNYNK